ncbi:MAG: SDR family oxidoreductase [Pseudomonadales bacterium]
MPTPLTQQVALVTGASRGIGKAIASALCHAGATVILTARDLNKLEQVVAELETADGQAIAIRADITREDDVESLFTQIEEHYGRINLLVNNAGLGFGQNITDMTLKIWQDTLDVNLTGAFLCSRAAMRSMLSLDGGRIINIGSISALAPRPGACAYTTSKAGLDGFTQALALEGRDHNIAVSIIHPGNTMTDIWAGKDDILAVEPIMEPDHIAEQVVAMAQLPLSINILSSVILPTRQKLVGRG